ncbi:MAG: hypothetical protein H7Z43_10865, partial [Clostridia bacterium]|nr:hypothetical protein [Deltaproteobacteria bacterium]
MSAAFLALVSACGGADDAPEELDPLTLEVDLRAEIAAEAVVNAESGGEDALRAALLDGGFGIVDTLG